MKIKIAPSTKTGAHHWLTQRISAVALILLIFWLVLSFVEIAVSGRGLARPLERRGLPRILFGLAAYYTLVKKHRRFCHFTEFYEFH
jgi:hypothetical protein